LNDKQAPNGCGPGHVTILGPQHISATAKTRVIRFCMQLGNITC